jgi:GAF domain-containing protein
LPRRKTVTAKRSPSDGVQNNEYEQPARNVRLLLAEAQALSTRLATLNEVAAAMQGKLDPTALLHTMALQARWVLDFQYCSVVVADRSGWRVQILASPFVGQLPPVATHPITPSILRTLQHGHAQLLQDVSPLDVLVNSQSALILPLRDGATIVGSLNFFAHNGHCYSQDDLRIAHALAVQVSAMLQNSRLFVAATRARDELHTVLESSSDGVLVIDRRGRILLHNSAFGVCLGLTIQMYMANAPLHSSKRIVPQTGQLHASMYATSSTPG